MDIPCWNCGKQITDLPERISFREICPFCHSYLHCCKNCTNYQPGLSNDCKIPGTEPISDREMRNTCEEFVLSGKAPTPKTDPKDVLKRLFGDD
jgi:hypothetical protein